MAAKKILLVGGGTGGHITPLIAVAQAVRQHQPDSRLVYVGETGGKFGHLVEGSRDIDGRRFVRAGKLRRYHGDSWLKRIFDFKTNLLNLRDIVYTLIGLIQSVWLMLRLRPDVVFIKGGFVGVPVGLAAALFRVPLITHDSDTAAGLANRIIGRWAKVHATAMPASFYRYPKGKVKHVGIPLSPNYKRVNQGLQRSYKEELGIPEEARVLLITGGSLGAQRLNAIASKAVSVLLQRDEDLYVLHQVGKRGQKTYEDSGLPKKRIKTYEFMPELFRYSGAADVIVARAGATSIAEFAVQGKACILIPHAQLTGGHQTKNAAQLEQRGAAIVLGETALSEDATPLVVAIEQLLDDPTTRQRLADNLASLAKTDASDELAKLILSVAK